MSETVDTSEAIGVMCLLNIPIKVEAAIRNYDFTECVAILEKLLDCGIKHECERSLLAQFPALEHYLNEQLQPKFLSKCWCEENSKIFQLYTCYKAILWRDEASVKIPVTSIALNLLGLSQTTSSDLKTLAMCRLVNLLKDMCVCDLQETVFHLLASALSKDVLINPPSITQALNLIFAIFYKSNPMAKLDETAMCAFETMIESSSHRSEGQTYEDLRMVLNTVWQFGVEMGDIRHTSKCSVCVACDCRTLFFLHTILTASFWPPGPDPARAQLAANVLSYALFDSDKPLVHKVDDLTRLILSFSEFMTKSDSGSLIEVLEAHCPKVLELIVLEDPAVRIDDREVDAELERRKELRLKNSIYEPVITDEEVIRVKEIQKVLQATRKNPLTGKSDNIPKKGYLLAAYRYALADCQDWKLAIEMVEQNPEKFQRLFTGAFKALPFYTTPEKLLEIMTKRKMQSMKKVLEPDGLESLDTSADRQRRDQVKYKTLALARETEGIQLGDASVVQWGTQEEVDELLETRAKELEELEGIEKARAENKARQDFRALMPKQRKKLQAAENQSSRPEEPTAAAAPVDPAIEEGSRTWGPDKMRGGRIPKPKAPVNKRTKTFDKHHARDRRMAKDER